MKNKFNFLIAFFILIANSWMGNLFSQDKKLWLVGGQNLNNTRNADREEEINPKNAQTLKVKWAFTTHGDVSATPTVDKDAVYFPDWGGFIYKVNAETGAVIWSHPLSFYTGVAGDFARASIAIEGNILVIGTQARTTVPATLDGGHMLAINKNTGKLIWKTKVDDFPGAVITQSAVVFENKVYVGVSSNEEALAANPNYKCCSFRGSFLSLDLNTGKILWKTYMIPAGKGFSGVAVWGSTPVIDSKRNSVYITTGNNYTVPQAVLDCVAKGGTPEQVRSCVLAVDGSKQNYFDAILALDLKSGAIKWSNSVLPFDAWTVACLFGGPNCPENAGPDYDFGQGPALFEVGKDRDKDKGEGKTKRDLLGAGQKSGIYWAFNPDNGEVVWQTQVGPGATLGGLEWGSAVDENGIYTAVGNSLFIPHRMTTGPGAGQTVVGGFWAALDPATGRRKWEVAGKKPPALHPYPAGAIAINTGMVSVANGVVFAGALDSLGTMYAFNAATGEILWSFESGGSVNSGAAIVDGVVYWGSGYKNISGTPNNKLYAFEPRTKNHHDDDKDIDTRQNEIWATVAPNPVRNEKLNLRISGQRGQTIQWEFRDIQGTILRSGKFDAQTDDQLQELNLSNAAPGTYFIRVVSGTKITSIRLVKLE